MDTLPKFDKGSSVDQSRVLIDELTQQLPTVLDAEDDFVALDWISEYAKAVSRVSDVEKVDLRYAEVIEQFEAHGYSVDYDADAPDADALKFISGVLERMKEGRVLTGYEGIFIDKLKAEHQAEEDFTAETADIA